MSATARSPLQSTTAGGAAPSFRCGPVVFQDVTAEEIVAAIAASSGPGRLFTALNAHTLSLALDEPSLLRILNESALCFCDGFGIHLLCRLAGFPAPRHRNTPTDFLPALLSRLASEGKTVFLVGDTEEVVREFAERTRAKHPGLVVGTHSGFFKLGSPEEEALLAEIMRVRPHAVLVGMGMPRQEYWAAAHAERLGCPSLLMIGASMAFLTGRRRRGPRWATDRGLEGFFRMVYEPATLWRRYLVEIPTLARRLRRLRHAR